MEFFLKISIIIPYFNSSKHLDTIEFSIKDYVDREDVEIIFIDDCSKDNEYEKLYTFVENLNAMNTILKRNNYNLGASGSRKEGVLISKGKYIAFLDSDDAWMPNKIDYQFKIMEDNNLTITGCLTKFIEKENLYKISFRELKVDTSYKEVEFSDFLFKNYFSTPSVMVLRSVIVENNFDDRLRYAEDYECWRRILIKHKGAVIEDLGVFSFKHSFISNGSLSSNILSMSKSEIIGIYWLFFNKFIGLKSKLMLPFALIYSMLKSLRRVFLYLVN